jgi:hypothetical protein
MLDIGAFAGHLMSRTIYQPRSAIKYTRPTIYHLAKPFPMALVILNSRLHGEIRLAYVVQPALKFFIFKEGVLSGNFGYVTAVRNSSAHFLYDNRGR